MKKTTKWCKWYCMIETTSEEYLKVLEKSRRWEQLTEEEQKILDAWKVCDKPDCHNKQRADNLAKTVSEELLIEVEKYLY